MAKKVHLLLRIGALLLFDIEFVFPQHLENRLHVLDMLLQSVAVHDDVVKVHYHKAIKIRVE